MKYLALAFTVFVVFSASFARADRITWDYLEAEYIGAEFDNGAKADAYGEESGSGSMLPSGRSSI